MPARLISIPFLLLTVLSGYLTYEGNESFSIPLLLSVIVLAIIYSLSPQVNWWWYKRFPPEIDPPIRKLLIQTYEFYNLLTVNDKKIFRNRMALYDMAVEFMPKGWDSIPEDVKGAIAANAVRLTFHKEDFLLPDFERIVVYATPFPSPQFPKTFHASELFEEDGVFLFSAQQVMWSFLQPKQYYNLVMHEYIKAYRFTYPNLNYPTLHQEDWPLLEKISGLSKDKIEGIINLELEPTVVAGTLFFTHPTAFQQFAPKLFGEWEIIFS